MGYSSYNVDNRLKNSITLNYDSAPVEKLFTQQIKREIHPDMDPKGVSIRECCDSEAHPNTVPCQLYLDVTGSMNIIPEQLIREDLPTLMSKIIQEGVKDFSLLFGAVGDHECDRCPLQVAQFESGDEELDKWLTRTFLEGGGGRNAGESYLLAWYFAGNHTKTDVWDKRKQKGFVFTIGDEPCLNNIPVSSLKDIMGNSYALEDNGKTFFTKEELLSKAQEKNNVFHIFLEHGYRNCDDAWKQLMGDNLIVISDKKDLVKAISGAIMKTMGSSPKKSTSKPESKTDSKTDKKEEIIL